MERKKVLQMFFSTYSNSQLLGKSFFPKSRQFMSDTGSYWFQRSWNFNFHFLLQGDIRFYITFIPFTYWYHRYFVDRVDVSESLEKAVIMRWGGTVEEVRKVLTPAEMVIAKNYNSMEIWYATYSPQHMLRKPLGCPLPGQEEGAH